uniref:Uncharacterized protein n=1 Tax=Sphaerodactylus townsendi TaxID=933632 RepID=A0ACB8E7D6_9SAUR
MICSIYDSTSATIIIKNGEWPSKSACQNGTAIKPVPRPRLYSLRNTPKGTKSKFSVVSPCVPKLTGALLPGRKTSGSKGNPQSGPSGQNGPRSLFSTFTSELTIWYVYILHELWRCVAGLGIKVNLVHGVKSKLSGR